MEASTDYVRAFAEQIRPFIPRTYRVLGADGFGRSGHRPRLRAFLEVDRHYLAVAALSALAEEGPVPAAPTEVKIPDIGSFGTAAGPFAVPEAIAAGMAEHVAAAGIDITISRGALLDHGAVQIPELILGGIDRYPTVPIFVNGVAAPFVPMQRVRPMGEAVGGYLAGLDERVLVIGSGGLSHDPPVPRWASATPEQRAFLLAGRHPTPEARAARQQRTISTAQAFARGEADIIDLNPEWDQAFMDAWAADDLSAFDANRAEDMAEAAGNSAHEVRCWVAACAAMQAAGPYRVRYRYYRAIPEYIAGFGALTATTA